MIKHRTHGRVGILGNPSDIYFGVVISSTLKDLYVDGKIKETNKFKFTINNSEDIKLDSLILNSLKFLKNQGYDVKEFEINFESNIPKQGGLAGSSAIIINLLLGLDELFDLKLEKRQLAHYSTKIERDVIGIIAGPSDRFIITIGGVMYMDFTSKDYNSYVLEELSLNNFPFWVGIRSKNISSGDVHKYPYVAYPNDFSLQSIIKSLIDCGIQGKRAIIDNDINLIAELINKNQKLTTQYGYYGNPSPEVLLERKMDQEMLNYCDQHGVLGVKLGGSSGSLVILSEEKPEFLLDFSPKIELKGKQELFQLESQIDKIIKLVPTKRLQI